MRFQLCTTCLIASCRPTSGFNSTSDFEDLTVITQMHQITYVIGNDTSTYAYRCIVLITHLCQAVDQCCGYHVSMRSPHDIHKHTSQCRLSATVRIEALGAIKRPGCTR